LGPLFCMVLKIYDSLFRGVHVETSHNNHLIGIAFYSVKLLSVEFLWCVSKKRGGFTIIQFIKGNIYLCRKGWGGILCDLWQLHQVSNSWTDRLPKHINWLFIHYVIFCWSSNISKLTHPIQLCVTMMTNVWPDYSEDTYNIVL